MGEHPDIPWRLPENLPPQGDIALGVSILDSQLKPVDHQHATYCLSKLLVGFNERKTKDEAKLLLNVWLEANGDLPDDLWSAGTLELLQTHKFGMPKPVHLREAVAKTFGERSTKLKRTRDLLKACQAKAEDAAEKPLATPAERIRDSIRAFTRLGMTSRAEAAQAKLDRLEGREPTVRPDRTVAEAPARPPFKADTTPAGRRCAELASAKRQGRDPSPTPGWDAPEYRDVPEVA